MIRISCTSCKAVLSVDDGFAGGVCRCQHCGTIQVVPASLKPTVKPQPPAPRAAAVSGTVAATAVAAATAPATAPATSVARAPVAAAPARTPIATAAPVVSISGAAAASLPPKSAAPANSGHSDSAHLLKFGVIIAFVLFLVLIALVFIFMREP
jgi:hypothetical protein